MIVPFAAGGTTDVTARIVGEHMSRTLGQPVVVENIVGAGGTVGSIRAMRANPDADGDARRGGRALSEPRIQT
jgi:tripartite-type tricarboxylate transporter receptor subunit TctC